MTDLVCGRAGDVVRLHVPEYVEYFDYRGKEHHPDWAGRDFWAYEMYCDLKRLRWSHRDAMSEVCSRLDVSRSHLSTLVSRASARKKAGK